MFRNAFISKFIQWKGEGVDFNKMTTLRNNKTAKVYIEF